MSDGTISVYCGCGKKLKAPATAVGRRARCPACGGTVILTAVTPKMVEIGVQTSPVDEPASAPPMREPATSYNAEDDGLGALYALANQEQTAPVADDNPRCFQCGSEMSQNAVLCTACGYDTRTGKAMSPAAAAVASTAGSGVRGSTLNYAAKPANSSAAEGSIILGIATCAGFAAAASLVWILVAWVTGFAIGYIAVLIGAAAGMGMKIGQKGTSGAGGAIAAGMTVVAILFAKLVVLQLYIIKRGSHASVFNLDAEHMMKYLFTPVSIVFLVIGVMAAFRSSR